jgi:hypothetical protein
MQRRALALLVALLTIAPAVAQGRVLSPRASATSSVKVRAGGYAQKASEVDKKEGSFEYSNGAVDLAVAKGGHVVKFAGMACNIGPTPIEGLPAYDEVSIKAPKHLPISSSGSFSYSGPVTLTPEDTQSEQSYTTTLTIKGRFQKGKIAATGTDSSPLCRPGTVTHFRLVYDPGAV